MAGKLAAHADWLGERARQAAPERLSATALLTELRQRGYDGGVTILREHPATLRPSGEPEAVVRFETAPGDQMQVDWAVVRCGADRLSAFIAVLGYSRAAYVEFVTDEKLETLTGCHQEAFVSFGGVPRPILYDNMRTVVVGRDVYGPGLHRFQPAFRDFAHHAGFRPRLCRPYRAKTKGKVERFIRYLRDRFLVPLTTRLEQRGERLDAMTANIEVRKWLRDVANARVHGGTGQVPLERLAEERPALQPLPLPWPGRLSLVPATAATPAPVVQHSLAVYDALLAAGEVA